MSKEIGRNKQKAEQKRIDRLKHLVGIDLCACGSANQLKCCGICRESHQNKQTGVVKCSSLYQINTSEIQKNPGHTGKRNWRFGRQKSEKDNRRVRQDRRENNQKDKP